jgi:hypothetical protein
MLLGEVLREQAGDGARRCSLGASSYVCRWQMVGQIGAFDHERESLKLRKKLLHSYNLAQGIDFEGPISLWVRIRPHGDNREEATLIARRFKSVKDQPYRWRLGRIVDPFGHHSEIASSLRHCVRWPCHYDCLSAIGPRQHRACS